MPKRSEPVKLPKRIYEARVPALREELVQMQVALKHAPFSVVLIVAGDDASGKGEVVNLLNGWLDPRGVETHAFREPTDEERERPAMWRYWRTLPPRGRMAIYVGGWHADALALAPATRREQEAFDADVRRLARFERLLAADGTLIVKLWLHLTPEQQGGRLRELAEDPGTAWRVTDEDWQHFHDYRRRAALAGRLRRLTHHTATPWHIVPAADPRARNLAVVAHLLERHAAHARVFGRARPVPRPRKLVPLRPRGLQLLRKLTLDQALSEADYAAKRDKWMGRLAHAVRAAAAQGRSIVWVFEGWDAAGKGGAIRRLTSAIDARDYRVIPVAKPTDEEKAHHYLWRFWRHLPRAGRATIYDRSWYGRVLVERIEGFCTPAEWRRAFDELNDFEAQLADHGTIVLKFWLHLSPAEQLRRFRQREETPYKRHKINAEDWRNRRRWAAYEVAVGDMLALTSPPPARWQLIPADNKRFARVEILKRSCRQIAAALG
jgi:polyphosphate:AMP phosphotransferase